MKKNIYYDKNGQEIKVGHVIKISNSYCKCDNGSWLVCDKYEMTNGEYHFHIQKMGRGDKLSEAAYACGFYPSRSTSFNVDKHEQQAWDAENQVVEIVELKNNEFIIGYFEEEINDMKDRIKNNYYISETEIAQLEKEIAKKESAIRTIKKEEDIVADIKAIEKEIITIENEIINTQKQKVKDEKQIKEFDYVINHVNSLLSKFYFLNGRLIMIGLQRTEFSKMKYYDEEGLKYDENEVDDIISKLKCVEVEVNEVQIEIIKNKIVNAKKRFEKSINSNNERIKKLYERIEMLLSKINSKYTVNEEDIVVSTTAATTATAPSAPAAEAEVEEVKEEEPEVATDEADAVKEYTTGRGTNEALIAAGKEAAGIEPEMVCHTYKKWQELGYQVMKGEKAKLKIELWHPSKYKNKDDEEEVKLYKKMTALFTVEQIQKIIPDELQILEIDFAV